MQTRVADAPLSATGTLLPEGRPSLPPRISWGAVIAGAIVAVAVGMMLNVLGLAVGAATLDPTRPGETPSAGSLGIGAGAWLAIANLIGLLVGGWVAARLSGTADGTDGVLHGLAVWAVGVLLSAMLLGNAVAGAASTAATGVSSLVGAAGRGAASAAREAAPAVASGLDPQALADRLRSSLQTGGDPAQMTADQRRAEIAQIATRRVTEGDLDAATRDRLSALVAADAGIPQEEARARIQRAEAEAQQRLAAAETQARQAAETAANAAATGAYWLFGALLVGALASALGARAGTRRAVPVAGAAIA